MPDRRIDHRLCIAPMMAWTDVHCRAFHRHLSPHARLYTEMVSVDALLRGGAERQLRLNVAEHPVALQLGGSEPQALGRAARVALARGFDEINLNVGCPSERVQRGTFGACLMRAPALVAECAGAIADATGTAPTVKCRLGAVERAGDAASYPALLDFVAQVARTGVETFIVHARVAVLGGLTPAQNRDVPPLRYDWVRRLVGDLPGARFVLNGGLRDTAEVLAAAAWADGVMVGRGAYQNPFWLCELETALFGSTRSDDRHQALVAFVPYIERVLEDGAALHDVTRHLFGTFNGLPGARAYRRHLSTRARRADAGIDVLFEAAALVSETADRTLAA